MATGRPQSLFFSTCAVLALFLLQPVRALQRSIGRPNDPSVSSASAQCHGNDPASYKHGACPNLIACVLDKLPPATVAGMQSGGNIVSLVPTILALLGAPPLDLAQLAFQSPHRALATCCFSIGLPSGGLFRQLKPLLTRLADRTEGDPYTRYWEYPLPPVKAAGERAAVNAWMYGRRRLVLKIAVEFVMLVLAGVMMWETWTVGSEIMITWRCEYGFLLFCWPMACIMWLFLSIVLLLVMKEKIEFYYTTPESPDASYRIKLSVLELMAMPYQFDTFPHSGTILEEIRTPNQDSLQAVHPHTKIAVAVSGTSIPSPSTPDSPRSLPSAATAKAAQSIVARTPTLKVAVTMPQEYGPRSWRWYEAILETLAVGVYLYATFVLTSTLFMSGQMGIAYAAVMTICLSGVRVLGSLF